MPHHPHARALQGRAPTCTLRLEWRRTLAVCGLASVSNAHAAIWSTTSAIHRPIQSIQCASRLRGATPFPKWICTKDVTAPRRLKPPEADLMSPDSTVSLQPAVMCASMYV